MQGITPELKAAFNPNNGRGARSIDYYVLFEVINTHAQEEASPSATEDSQISRIEQITGRMDAMNFASFEPGGWPLDGSKVIPPEPDELPDAGVGLVMPDLSDEDGFYTSPQVITLTTVEDYNLLAVTLDFGYSPSADFSIDLYNGETLLYHHEVEGNTNRRYMLRHAQEDVNKMVITVTRSAVPERKVRLMGVAFGAVLEYNKANSDSLDITEIIDPLNERIPSSDMKLVVDNFSREFDLFDPTSLYAFFQDRQEISPKIGAQQANGQWGFVKMGKFYLQRPILKGDLAKLEIKANNLLGVLADSVYSKGTYKTSSLANFANDLAIEAGVPVSYPASWETTFLTAYIPSVSFAEGFRRLAQATNTLLTVSRDGAVTFLEIGEDVDQVIGKTDYRSGTGFSPSDEDIVNTVTLEVSTLSVADSAEELAKVTGAGTYCLQYDPSTEHTASIDGGTIESIEYYVDNAIITITGGTAIVSGKKIITTRSLLTESVAKPGERSYLYEVKGQPFIQPVNAPSVLSHYLALKATNRKKAQVQYRGYPYLEVGDILTYNTGDLDSPPFILMKNTLKLVGGMTGTMESRERP